MANKGKIKINRLYCKGCGLCLDSCHFKAISLSPEYETNENGYRYLKVDKEGKCTGCTLCAVMCPEQAIEVYRENGKKK